MPNRSATGGEHYRIQMATTPVTNIIGTFLSAGLQNPPVTFPDNEVFQWTPTDSGVAQVSYDGADFASADPGAELAMFVIQTGGIIVAAGNPSERLVDGQATPLQPATLQFNYVAGVTYDVTLFIAGGGLITGSQMTFLKVA